ncbi:MAG TPA: hypothetical protein VFP96_04835 [Candidatus Acidoferrum sp.]|nr:hypothetical protein [Candidatus Acidoferrum sp.]
MERPERLALLDEAREGTEDAASQEDTAPKLVDISGKDEANE